MADETVPIIVPLQETPQAETTSSPPKPMTVEQTEVKPPTPGEILAKKIVSVVSIVMFIVFSLVGFIYIGTVAVYLFRDPTDLMNEAIRDNSTWTLGIPFAAMASFVLVVLLPISTGNQLKFEALTVKLEGSSSQLLFWIVCYLTLVLSIKTLNPRGEVKPLNSHEAVVGVHGSIAEPEHVPPGTTTSK
jgi:hypothetical protein